MQRYEAWRQKIAGCETPLLLAARFQLQPVPPFDFLIRLCKLYNGAHARRKKTISGD